MKNSVTSRIGNAVKAISLILLVFTVSIAKSQVVYNGGASNVYNLSSNWKGGSVPGTTAWAQYGSSGSVNTQIIVMSNANNNGTNNQAVGAIEATTARGQLLQIGASGANGLLTLNGATVNGITNVVLSNSAAFSLSFPTSSPSLRISIPGTTNRNFVTAGGSSSTLIGSTISMIDTITSSAPFTFLGGGTWNGTTGNAGGLWKFTGGGQNFSGGVTVGKSDGTQSGVFELDAKNTLLNTTGNDITVNPNSELYLNAAGGTFNTSNINLTLNGNGNPVTLTTPGGALVTKTSTNYTWLGNISLASDATITTIGTSTFTDSGNIVGSGALIKSGSSSTGKLLLAGAVNNWSGGTQVGVGAITVAPVSSISTGALSFTGLTTNTNTNVTFNNAAQTISSLSSSFLPTSGTQTQTLSLSSGHTLTLDQSTNTVFGSNGTVATQTSIISGAGALIKKGTGRLTLTSNGNALTGGLTITAGEIRFNPRLSTTTNSMATCPVTLNGGKLTTTGDTSAVTINFGVLTLSANSTIDLGTSTTNSIKFAASSSATWTGSTVLKVTNWQGNYGGVGTVGRLFIGTASNGVTSNQLAQIKFDDGSGYLISAAILSTGEIIPATNTWTGAVSTDWNNASNWSDNVVPSSTTDAIIPSVVNQPVIASTRSVKAITIASGATLSNNGDLNVHSNFVNNGRFISGSGSSVILKSTGTLSGTDTFANLEVIGTFSVGASASDKVYVTEKLIKSSGTLTTNDKLTLVSTAMGSAMIEDDGGALSGRAYIQHYAGGNFGYHQFSSPLSDGIVSMWGNVAFPLFGEDGVVALGSKRGSLQIYDEVKNANSILDSGYYNYTALSNALTAGIGYTAWLNSLPTLSTFGTPNDGEVSPVSLTHSAGTNDPRGWNLVGNPYPSPISWTALKAFNPGLFGDASCYLWKAAGVGIDGTWSTYDGTVGVNGAGDVINSSLGFFVYVEKSGTMFFDNSVRTYNFTNPEIFGGKSSAANTLKLSIKAMDSKLTDEAVAYTSYRASFSRKMAQPEGATNATIAFDVKGTKAAINVLTAIDSKTELPVTVLTPKAGTYTLSLSTKNINLPVYLKDAVTGTYTDLSSATTITTSAKETIGRYSLVFSKSISIVNSQLSIYPNPAKNTVVIKGSHIASVQVVDNLGRVVRTVSLKDAMNPTLNVSNLHAGGYHLRVQTTDGKVSNLAMIKE